MSDLVINVKQIGSYPLLNPITGTEMLLVQSGGLGGPYYSVQMSQMIVNTLANFEGPIAIGVGQAPPDGNPDTVFSGDSVLTSGPLGVSFNAYGFSGAGVSGFKYWQNGFAGCFYLDPASGGFAWQFAPNGQAGSPIYSTGGGPSLFTTGMTLSPAGYLQLASTLLVARAPTIPLEVATKGYVDGLTGATNVVQSFNTRTGAVTLSLLDITTAGGAPIMSPVFTGIPQAPTPVLGTNTNQIATTNWVLDQITAVTAGVVTWNGRSGVVTMTQADITNAGGITQITANATFLPLAGGTMAGPITMSSAAVANMDVPVLGQVGARVGATNPPATPAPVSGQLWWDSAGAQLYAWTGQQWVIAVNPPVPNTANFLAITGGTMTGRLNINSNLNVTGSLSPNPGLPSTGVGTGTSFGALVTGYNLGVNVYNNGTTWAQLPGTGTAGGTPSSAVLYAASANQAIIYVAAPAADNAAVNLQTAAEISPSQAAFPGSVAGTGGSFSTPVGAGYSPLNLQAGSGTGNGDCIANWTVPTISTWSVGIQATTANFYIQQNVPNLGLSAFMITPTGDLQLGAGVQCRSGATGGFTGNVHNIEWVGLAYLWIDNVNQGAFAFQSDYRIKKDVADLPSMWETTKKLHPIKYTQAEYNPPGTTPKPRDPNDKNSPLIPMYPADDVERWGFVAHELQEHLTKSAASGEKDQPDLIQSPNPFTLLACMCKALQEAMTRIEALEGAR